MDKLRIASSLACLVWASYLPSLGWWIELLRYLVYVAADRTTLRVSCLGTSSFLSPNKLYAGTCRSLQDFSCERFALTLTVNFALHEDEVAIPRCTVLAYWLGYPDLRIDESVEVDGARLEWTWSAYGRKSWESLRLLTYGRVCGFLVLSHCLGAKFFHDALYRLLGW